VLDFVPSTWCLKSGHCYAVSLCQHPSASACGRIPLRHACGVAVVAHAGYSLWQEEEAGRRKAKPALVDLVWNMTYQFYLAEHRRQYYLSISHMCCNISSYLIETQAGINIRTSALLLRLPQNLLAHALLLFLCRPHAILSINIIFCRKHDVCRARAALTRRPKYHPARRHQNFNGFCGNAWKSIRLSFF